MTNSADPTPDDLSRDLAADLATCDAATPGKWYWNLSLKSRCVRIESTGIPDHMQETIMDFVRWGMGGAKPRLRHQLREQLVVMRQAEDYAEPVPGRLHHASWFQSINHPDAVFMVEARQGWPAAVRRAAAAEAECERLRAEVDRLANELMRLQSDPGYDEQRNVGADLAAGLVLSVINGKRPQLADGPLRAAADAVASRCDEVARLREAAAAERARCVAHLRKCADAAADVLVTSSGLRHIAATLERGAGE